MFPDIRLPETWVGVVGLAIVGLFWFLVNRQRGIRADVAAVKSQVQNGHGDDPDRNLRSDLDRVLAVLNDIRDKQDHQGSEIRGLRKDIGGLHGAVSDVRESHASLERRVDRLRRPWWQP